MSNRIESGETPFWGAQLSAAVVGVGEGAAWTLDARPAENKTIPAPTAAVTLLACVLVLLFIGALS